MKLKALLLATAITTAIPIAMSHAGDRYGDQRYLTVSPKLASGWTHQVSNQPARRSTWGVGQRHRYQQQRRYHNAHSGHRVQTYSSSKVRRYGHQQVTKPYNRKTGHQKIWRATGIFAGLAPNAQANTNHNRRGSVQFITKRQSQSQRQRVYQHNLRQRSNRRVRIDQQSQLAFAPQYDHNRAQAYIEQETVKRGVDPAFLPATVPYETAHAKGTIIINTNTRYLYLVLGNGQARRFGVGVGKSGFEWSGTEKISRKAEWPSWRPPAEMIAREREKGRDLPVFMEGGPANPLGARALYLGSTLYRIHGTNQPWSIGQAVSSGCIRMRNEDVIELYERVPVGAKVVVS